MASGWVTSEKVYELPHYNPEKAEQGETALRADVEFDQILNPATESLLSVEGIEEGPLSLVNWKPLASGMEIPQDATSDLEYLWSSHLQQVGRLGVDDSVAEALEKSLGKSQGFLLDSKLRKALEDHAMDAAKRYFESEGYVVEDRSKTCPYDLRCRRGEAVLYVEVKGTQTNGCEIILTAGEVDFARGQKGQMGLFVLHSIPVSEGNDGYVLGDGKRHLIQPWDVDLGTLKPMAFKYELPGD